MTLDKKKDTFNGIYVSELKKIEPASEYDHNYYICGKYIILGVSDDDNETEWYLISHDKSFDLIGYSYTSHNPETIIVSENMHT